MANITGRSSLQPNCSAIASGFRATSPSNVDYIRTATLRFDASLACDSAVARFARWFQSASNIDLRAAEDVSGAHCTPVVEFARLRRCHSHEEQSFRK
jgi:hypothetical protein